MLLPKADATHYYTQLELTDKRCAIKEFLVYYSCDLEPLYLLNNGLALKVVINRPLRYGFLVCKKTFKLLISKE